MNKLQYIKLSVLKNIPNSKQDACPLLNYILLTKDEVWVPGIYAVIHKTEKFFGKDLCDSLKDKKYLIYKDDWEFLCKDKFKYTLIDNILKIWKDGIVVHSIPLYEIE